MANIHLQASLSATGARNFKKLVVYENGNYFENIQHIRFTYFLYGSENWTLTALQRRRTEAAEMKLLRPLAGYTLYDHKTNDYIRRELRITGILDKMDE